MRTQLMKGLILGALASIAALPAAFSLSPSVPGSGIWLTMLAGFGVIGTGLRRRRPAHA